MLKVYTITALEMLKKDVSSSSSKDEFIKIVVKFRESYTLFHYHGAFDIDFERAQNGLMEEINQISQKGLKNTCTWHKLEIIFLVDEMLENLKTE